MTRAVVLASLFTVAAYAARVAERQADVHVSDFVPWHAGGPHMPRTVKLGVHATPPIGTHSRSFPSMAMQKEGEDKTVFPDEPQSADVVATIVEPAPHEDKVISVDAEVGQLTATEAPKKVAIVTGASTGIGLATVEGMARSGLYDEIVLAGRNPAKHEFAVERLKEQLGSVADGLILKYMPLELTSLQSVRDFATDFLNSGSPLHTLVLNAGVMAIPERRTTEDGYEYQFGVNHLSHFLLANLLLDRLVASASSADPGRVISLSSAAHQIPSPLLSGDVGQLSLDKDNYNNWVAYGQSKLCNLLFAYELDLRCRELGLPIAANAVHPGGVDTELARYLGAGSSEATGPLTDLTKPLRSLAIKTPEDGAGTSVLLATSPMGKLSGRYWLDKRPAASLDVDPTVELPGPAKAFLPVKPRFTSYNPETWSELWKESEKLSGLKPAEVSAWRPHATSEVQK